MFHLSLFRFYWVASFLNIFHVHLQYSHLRGAVGVVKGNAYGHMCECATVCACVYVCGTGTPGGQNLHYYLTKKNNKKWISTVSSLLSSHGFLRILFSN